MQKVRDHCHYTGKYRGAAHSNCNLKYRTTKKIPVVFHNGSTYDYHFIIKQLAREFKYYLECLGENTEKYITFSVPIKKQHDNNKTATKQHGNGKTAKEEHDNGKTAKKEHSNGKTAKKRKTTTYRLNFIDSYRFMQCSLSTLVDNLSGNDKKESCNKFTDNTRFMTDSLWQSSNKISQA